MNSVVNASAGRIYRLALTGYTMVQVGTDGGLFEKPVEMKEILLTTGERVELLVRGSDAPGGKSVLQNAPYDRYVPQTRPKDWETTRDLLTLQTTNDAPVTPPAGTPFRILMFLNTLSAGSFSRPAIERRTIAAALSRRTALTLSRTLRVESVSGLADRQDHRVDRRDLVPAQQAVEGPALVRD